MENLKDDPFTWSPDLAFPLVFSTLNAADIITNVDTTNIYMVDDDNFVTLIYRNVVFSKTINDLFKIPNAIPFLDSRSLSGTEVSDFNNNGSVSAPFNGDHGFDLDTTAATAQLEFVEFYDGSTMEVALLGDFLAEGSVTVSYPELTLSGVPLSHTFNFDNTTGQGISQSASKDIAGYRLVLSAPTPNNLEMNYQFNLTTGSVDASNSIQAISVLNNARIGLTVGDFGQINLEIAPDVVDIDILDNQQEGNLNFIDPRLKVTMKNSFGMSMQGTINQLRAIGDGAQFIDVDYTSVTGSPFIIDGGTNPGDTNTVEWYFTGTQNVTPGSNSNIDLVMNANYQDLVYDLDASTNPAGGSPNPNWATANSALEVTADIELPFWGTASNFTIRDTIDFPIGDADEFRDNIIEALLRVNTLNGFPVDGALILHFTDSLYNITASVLNNGELLVRSGTIDANGRVVSQTNENNDIILDTQKINAVFGAKYIILDAIMNSTNGGQTAIRLYDDYELQVNLGFQVKLSASPSDLDGL
ncbi:MAG: hypothetical protein ACI9P8_001112 [Bacteroidia bacterium]